MKIVISSNINNDATKVKNYIETINKDINQIQDVINYVPNAWQGTDATSFMSKYTEALKQLKKYKTSFDDYYKFLSKVYGVFDSLEEAYDKKISTD